MKPKRTHKYEIELPEMVNKSYALENKNGSTIWANTIVKEMHKVKMPFQILLNGVRLPQDIEIKISNIRPG